MAILLLLDTNNESDHTIRNWLAKEGHAVLCEKSFQEVINNMEKIRPALIIINEKGLSDFSLQDIKKLRKKQPKVKILLLTEDRKYEAATGQNGATVDSLIPISLETNLLGKLLSIEINDLLNTTNSIVFDRAESHSAINSLGIIKNQAEVLLLGKNRYSTNKKREEILNKIISKANMLVKLFKSKYPS